MVAGWRLQVLDGFAGISKDGLFGTPPSWVNKSKPPGHSSLEEELGLWSLLKRTATLSYFFWSPNLACFAMTFAVYKLAPYDLNAAAQGFALNWVLKRFMTNFAVALTYYGFFFSGHCMSSIGHSASTVQEFTPLLQTWCIIHGIGFWGLFNGVCRNA